MSKKTSYLFGILLTIIIGTLLYCYLCDDCHCYPDNETKTVVEDNKVVEPVVKAVTLNPFSIKDANGNFVFNNNDNFNFNSSRFKILDSVSIKVDNGILRLKDYFNSNNMKRLNITGHYTSNETNNSAFPNLGLARANAVKNYFVSKGVSSKLMNTFGELNDKLIPSANNVFFGPVNFGISTNTADTVEDDALKAKCEAIRANPLVLYFKTGQASINLTAEQRQKIADISRCVDKLGVKVQVVGHTDSAGNANRNLVLGKNRAEFAKNYLVRNGILGNNIEATSKGETQPIADNNTEDGKAKNRRTVVTIN
jgi:outer membrane protein OmpA-like peptidoglycan-associated protein